MFRVWISDQNNAQSSVILHPFRLFHDTIKYTVKRLMCLSPVVLVNALHEIKDRALHKLLQLIGDVTQIIEPLLLVDWFHLGIVAY